MSDFPNNVVSQAPNGNGTVRFGEFEADLQSGEVRKSGNRVKLQEQPFKVLQVLLERPGMLVTREELRSRIWPDENFGDFDHAVNVAVGKLRTALGDSAENPLFIETIPRRGYRFVAMAVSPGEEAQPTMPPPTDNPPHEKKIAFRRLIQTMLALAVGGVLLTGGVIFGRRTAEPIAPEFQQLSVMRGTVYSARFAPDGHNVIYSAAWSGKPVTIYSTDVNFSGARNLGMPDTALLAVS